MVMLETVKKYLRNGWVEAGETWTYASADDPTYTFTVAGDVTGKYHVGMRVKLTQTTVKYFIITAVSYSSPNTTVTIYGGTDYDLANAAITENYVSSVKAPSGFPIAPDKWRIVVYDTSARDQSSPTNDTWKSFPALEISIPIGAWNVFYNCFLRFDGGTAAAIYQATGLSTSTSSLTNQETEHLYEERASTGVLYHSHSGQTLKVLTVKTTYYLIAKVVTSSTLTRIRIDGSVQGTFISATCAYL